MSKYDAQTITKTFKRLLQTTSRVVKCDCFPTDALCHALNYIATDDRSTRKNAPAQ